MAVVPVQPRILYHRNIPQMRLNSSKSSLATMTKEYGPLAVLVYASLAFPTFCGCLYAVTYMGITEEDIKKAFDTIKTTIGLDTKSSEEEPSKPTKSILESEWIPDWAKTKQFQQFATNCLLAMAMTKLFSPIKFGLTAMIVPSLGKRLKQMGWIKVKPTK
jgi:hypothetical protein